MACHAACLVLLLLLVRTLDILADLTLAISACCKLQRRSMNITLFEESPGVEAGSTAHRVAVLPTVMIFPVLLCTI